MHLVARHYVYEWFRPDYDIAFYVGKGAANRAYKFSRNKHTNDVVSFLNKKGMKPCVRILARFVNEDAAYDFEEERIAYWGLENLTNELPGGRNGGGGMQGKTHCDETKIKIGLANRGKVISINTRIKLRNANVGKKLSDATKKKISKANTGANRTKQTCLKISTGVSAAKNTAEGKIICLEAARKISLTPGVKERRAASFKKTMESRPSHWKNKLTDEEVWLVGTLLCSKKDLAKRFKISVQSVDVIRNFVENMLGIGRRENVGNQGKKLTSDTVQKCKKAREQFWANKTDEERADIGRKMSEGRKRAKEAREAAAKLSELKD